MNVIIVGAGRVGKALGKKWQNKHNITFLVRNTSRYQEIVGGTINVSDDPQVLVDAEVIILAIPAASLKPFVEAHRLLLGGKVVVDATNNVGNPDKGMAYLSKQYSTINWIKAFNSLGFNIMEDAQFGDLSADGYIAGEDQEALRRVSQLTKELGLEPIVFSSISFATNLEALAWMWITLSREKGRDIAFKLLIR